MEMTATYIDQSEYCVDTMWILYLYIGPNFCYKVLGLQPDPAIGLSVA